MTRRIANCPACGGPVEFQLSTALVTVCDFCHSVVARGDKKLEDHGKVADLVDTHSPISRGQAGQFEKKSFEVVGRVQYQHPAGGVWDEWYLKFPNDRVKWLAHAQGKFYLTTEKRLSDKTQVPDYDKLTPGHKFDFPGVSLVVGEKGIANAITASGDIPWDFRPGAEHRFIDLQGSDNTFATIEYEQDGPRIFLGREISLEELGLRGEGWDMPQPANPNTAALNVNCPQCGGPLELHAPDQSLRVCCPSCKSLLDCQHGKLQYLQTLQMKRGEKILIPLGSKGTLFGVEYTVIGFMTRFVVADGKKYRWSEYLLSNPQAGFRWLVRSNGHWSFVESIPVSSVSAVVGRKIEYQGQTFKAFDQGTSYVSYVVGEFYWKVTVNEQVDCTDYIAPPRMISFERTTGESGEELNVSLGTYVEKEVLETAFGIKEIPAPWGVGSIQPVPRIGDVMMIWLLMLSLMILLNLVFSKAAHMTFSQLHFYIAVIAVTAWPMIMFFMRSQFESNRWEQSDFTP